MSTAREVLRVMRLYLVVGGSLTFFSCGGYLEAFLLVLIGIYVETWGRR